MNSFAKKALTLAASAAIALASGTVVHAATAQTYERPGSQALQYPNGSSQFTVLTRVLGSGPNAILEIRGRAAKSRTALANVSLNLSLTSPAGKTVRLGRVQTNSLGFYSKTLKSAIARPGVYRISLTYLDDSFAAAFSVKR